MDIFDFFGRMFAKCWELWNYDITFGSFTFTLANVAEVGVWIFVFCVAMDAVLNKEGWGVD